MIDDTDFEWLMAPAMPKYVIPAPLAHVAEIRRWAAQKGGNTKIHLAVDTQILYHFWHHSGLHSCGAVD